MIPGDRRVTVELGHLRSAVAARAGNRTTTLANRLLEDVDRIEGTFGAGRPSRSRHEDPLR